MILLHFGLYAALSRAKILKVWAFWGDEQPNVSLSMRSLNDYFLPGESSLYMRSKRRHKRQSKQRSSRHSPTCKCHDKRSCGECSRLKSLEHLVKLVVSQERKLQDITDHIVDTDRLIEKHEGRIHEHRVQQNGLDYVQESYLNSHSSGSSSSVDSACLSVATLDLNEARGVFSESSLAELGEITRMCDQLNHLERCLAVERAKGEELELEIGRIRQERGQDGKEGELNNAGVEEARVELLRAVTSHVTQEYNERMLDRRMETCLAEVEDRTAFLHALQSQIAEVESRLVPNMGSDRMPSDSDTHDNPLDHPSSESDGDVFPPGHLPLQPHSLTHRENPNSGHVHIPPPLNSGFLRQPHHPSSENSASKFAGNSNTAMGGNSGDKPDTPGTGQSSLSSRSPGKSMTGRGRFARDPIRKTVGPVGPVGSTVRSNVNHQQQLHSANSDSSGYGDGDSKGNYSYSSVPHPSSGGQSYVPFPASFRSPSSRDSQSLASGKDNIDSANIGRAEEINSASVNTQRRGQSGDVTNYQIPVSAAETGFGVTGQFLTNGSRGGGNWTNNSTQKYPGVSKGLRDSAMSSAGSCGDLSRLDTSSPSPGMENLSGDGYSMFVSRGRNWQQVDHTTAYRRSRSADRDSSHSQGHVGRVNIRGPKQITQQYAKNSNHIGESQANANNIGNHSRAEPASLGTGGWNQQKNQNQNAQRNALRSNNVKFSLPPNFIPGSSVSNKDEALKSNISANSSQIIDNVANYQHPNKNNNSKQQQSGGQAGYSPLFEQNKLARGQNTPAVSVKPPNRTTGFIFRVAEQDRLGVPANSNNGSTAGSAPQNGYCLRRSNDLRTDSRSAQDLDGKKDALFAHRISGNSQNKQQRDSSSPSFNNFGAKLQAKTSLFSHADACSEPAKDVSVPCVSQDKQKSRDPINDTVPPASTNASNSVETDPSRGALYHILSQKLNASKEKIRLTSEQDATRDQSGRDVNIHNKSETQSKGKQLHSNGTVLNGNVETASSNRVMNGTSQPWPPTQTSGSGATVVALNTQGGQGGRSFVLATSTAAATVPSATNRTDHNTRILDSNQVAPVSASSQNVLSSPVVSENIAVNSGAERNLRQSNPATYCFNDAGKKSFPQQSQHSQNHQHHQFYQSQQHHFNQQQHQKSPSPYLHQHQQQHQDTRAPNQNQHDSSIPQQNQRHHQNATVWNGCNHHQNHAVPGQSSHTKELQQPENTPNRRSALNPNFYDMNKPGAKFPSRPAPKKPLLNGNAGLLDYQYHQDDSTNSIISYLKHSNSGFLENLKSSAPPASLSSSRPVNNSSGTNSGRGPVPSILSSFPNADSFDVNEPRRTKTKMEDSNDSDTGLSSMHSDETANMETLV
ncbi:Ras and Rab interactor 2 [Elysia marginata]|uniref:Ras and Rab interactor 2 n=1 Tax=Elysia marginata TaxID=1093978 RepID=A0AAV4GEA4_9GAST|nr:Ras and Rab interactor 2 [Elysia marginata]